MNLKTPIGRFRLIAIMEGISFLLFAITMPLKYMLGITGPNFVVGLAHGILFILYGFLCIQCIFIYSWKWKMALMSLGASLLPFATFVMDHKHFRHVRD